jgi:signal transduction histidine kinase/ActR/RegA family two-component response regulator
MKYFDMISLLAGLLQLAVACYALRLNRMFGTSRVGWSLCSAFALLALLHLTQSLESIGLRLSIGFEVNVIYVLISLLLLIALAHIESVSAESLRLAQEEQRLRADLEERVKIKTAALGRINEELRQEIARREQKEKALQQSEQQLRQAQKMEAIGQLAGGVAHDFNNLITVIGGYASLLLQQPNLAENAEQLAQISAAANRAAGLTRQLLTFSRRHHIQAEPLNMNGVIENLTKMLRRLLGEDIMLQNCYGSNLPPVVADAGMIEQVIMNLVVNARDAMPKGGTLTLSAAAVEIDALHAQHCPEASAGQYVCLKVQDTGCGMSPEILSHLFEPFFTTKDIGKGTGLGLATIYGIVKQHSGWIEVHSQPGAGTEFTVYFPATPQATLAAPQPQGMPAAIRGGETILLVEDEQPVRGLARCILGRHGYQVIEADCGASALALWQTESPRIDMLLTDMVMPGGISGRDLASRLRQSKPDLKVVYTSGYSPSRVGQDPKLLDGLKFLPKPYNPDKLIQAVQDCLANRS